MATKSPARARTSSAPRSSQGGSRKGSTRSAQSRGASSRSVPRTAPKPSARRQPGPVARFIRAIGRTLARIWLFLAAILGGITRAVGRSARDLDATHRRDGIGLLLFTLTIVVAAVTWFSIDGWLTGIVTAIVTGAFGALDVVVPLFLFWATLRVLRHPDQGSTTGRLAIGTGILLASACGIWSLIKGAPSPSDGSEAMRAAGRMGGLARHRPDRVRGRDLVGLPVVDRPPRVRAAGGHGHADPRRP